VERHIRDESRAVVLWHSCVKAPREKRQALEAQVGALHAQLAGMQQEIEALKVAHASLAVVQDGERSFTLKSECGP
jgi:hypothetical protein